MIRNDSNLISMLMLCSGTCYKPPCFRWAKSSVASGLCLGTTAASFAEVIAEMRAKDASVAVVTSKDGVFSSDDEGRFYSQRYSSQACGGFGITRRLANQTKEQDRQDHQRYRDVSAIAFSRENERGERHTRYRCGD